MKIFRMNDCDWWMAESAEEAIKDALTHFSMDEADLANYLYEGGPEELTEAEMDALQYWIDVYDPEIERHSFREELQRRLDAGITEPEFFASTEY